MAAKASANTSKRRQHEQVPATRASAGGRARKVGADPSSRSSCSATNGPAPLVDTPAWQDLPAATQAVLTSLIARLILDHAETRAVGPVAGGGHDL